MDLFWTLVMVYGTAQNGYTLTNGPKCGLSIMKHILIKAGMYFIHKKLHTYILYYHNTIFRWFLGATEGMNWAEDVSQACILLTQLLRSMKLQSDWVAVSLLFCFFLSPYAYHIIPHPPPLPISMGPRYILLTCHVNTIFIDTFDALTAFKWLDIMHTGCT